MTLTCTIGGNNVSLDASEQQQIENSINNRSVASLYVIDKTGTLHFQHGQPVTISDSVLGTFYTGYVDTSKETWYPGSTAIQHFIECMDQQYLADKRLNFTNYIDWYSGDIVLDMVRRYLAIEGVTIVGNIASLLTQSDFATGTLSGTTATTNNAGDLELAPAGTNVTITESTTANFSTGTLTNVVAANNTLAPTTQSAISLSATLQTSVTGAAAYAEIWSGSMTVGTLDSLHYEIWINGTSPQACFGVDFTFSDGTFLHSSTSSYDQNGLLVSPATDLALYATNKWYSRTIALGSAYNGKTITAVQVAVAGTSTGTYVGYFKNIYLVSQSGSPFFSTTATATQVSPAVPQNLVSYPPQALFVSVVQVFDPANCYRISSATSISAVALLKNATVIWSALTPGGSSVTLYASYDGVCFQPCVNGGPLPALPAGSALSGLSLTLKEAFGSTDPTHMALLEYVTVTLNSAPNPSAAKTDVVTGYGTQTAWNTGTLTNLVANANGDLTVSTTSRSWSNNLFPNQSLQIQFGSGSQSASSGQFHLNAGANSNVIDWFDFAGLVSDFTLDIDVIIGSVSNNSTYILYRQYSKSALPGYYFLLNGASNTAQLIYNGTVIGQTSFTVTSGTTTHVKIVVVGSTHLVYIGGSSTPQITATDSNVTMPGSVGVRVFTGASSGTSSFVNFVLNPATTGTWQSASVSLTSAGTCATSVISWTEASTSNQTVSSVLVQTSIDNGSTFQTCTNGGTIPNLTAGTNLSGKNLIVLITMNAASQPLIPIVRQLAWRVLGAYSGSSGTRSTAPLGIDTMVRANQVSSWGTSFDGQTYTKTGTGTIALTSNEATIAATTGDVHMQLGSKMGSDMDETVRLSISASGTTAGLEVRYMDVNDWYRLAMGVNSLSIIRNSGGTLTTLASVAPSVAANTFYRLRYRVQGSNHYGRVWVDGTLEPTTWTITASG